ncbi:lipase family protein [Reichenbachiella ulvae]|uniref:Lipase family protein n=1 Tax=Reichenbachiella ulvae TaxID=2980104 RepID=A0ABT3CRS4_9BACT|nr:lipase family protein [Reichenbachiella ulvae]MCV9386339.1 lipase family protein [Reichenbachiella ulvae]
MKKVFIFLLFLFFFQVTYAQFKSGLVWHEVKDMIQICNSFTYLELYDDDSVILPDGYKKEFTSGTLGMDNKFQVYIKGENEAAVLNFRGSTDQELSWLANFKSAMIPAKGQIKIQSEAYDYDLSDDSTAAVHSGYLLGLAYLHQSVLMQIKYLNAIGIYDIYITGHSQGGSLAALMMVYLDRLGPEMISDKNQFKMYAFANPMIGNKSFVDEYNLEYAKKGWSFSFIIPSDIVPKLPISYEEGTLSSKEIHALVDGEIDRMDFLSNILFNSLNRKVTRFVDTMSSRAESRIVNELGSVEMPKHRNEINYYPIGNRFELPPVEYPKVLKDSSILKSDSLLNKISIDPATGHVVNKHFYKKEPMFFQHKPHNYYLSLMKTYFRQEYDVIRPEILPENL